jgi:fructan beta-fructosidase
VADDILFREPYRPQFHFSPAYNWMNDPNGLVYYAGEYHLFFQCNPEDLKWDWRKLHWGHAISTDLLHWREFPIALSPDTTGSILSGSIVVDMENTSGFKTGVDDPLIAIYTSGSEGNSQHPWDAFQQQSIAFSNDRGRTWIQYSGNPVISNPGLADFRDPKVFWHSPSAAWVMVLAAGDRVRFYQSQNLKSWMQVGGFGVFCGAHGGIWECPDLFPMILDDGSTSHWVLIVSVQAGATLQRSGTQYFVGQFDGRTFLNDNPSELILWLDNGPDNYAGGTWSNLPSEDARRLFMGWMNGANRGPTWPWRGAMSIPRELTLRTIDGQIRLMQNPVRELALLRESPTALYEQTVGPRHNLIIEPHSRQYEIVTDFSLNDTNATQFGFKFRVGSGQEIGIVYHPVIGKLTLYRGSIGKPALGTDALLGSSTIGEALFNPHSPTLRLHILVDWSSIEVFANEGQIAITACIFPEEYSDSIEFFAFEGNVRLNTLIAYPLHSTTPIAD